MGVIELLSYSMKMSIVAHFHSSCVAELLVFPVKMHDEVLVSSMDTSRQLILNEQLEDMRQELVRQYEEHQQATEMLRQAHMQQMERQREDQEQLQEEIKRLNEQLTQVGMEEPFSPQLK